MNTAAVVSGNRSEDIGEEIRETKRDTTPTNRIPTNRFPIHWRDVVDESDSTIIWRQENTLAIKLLGEKRGRNLIFLLTGTPLRFGISASINVAATALGCLADFKIVSNQVMISVATVIPAWILLSVSIFCDLAIVKRILFRDVVVFANLWLAVLFTIGFACILDWDTRGCANIPVYVAVLVSMSLVDAFPFHIRVATVPLLISLMSTVVFLMLCVNLGLLPDQNPNAVLYTIRGVGNIPLSVSAYGTFNDAGTALLLLNLNEIRARWPNRKKGTLRTVKVSVEGKDAPGGIDYAWVEKFVC